jgi:hypothetical protein
VYILGVGFFLLSAPTKKRNKAVVRTSYFRAFVVLAAIVVAALVGGVVILVKPTEAAFPGANGKIAFSVYGQHGGGSFQNEVYAMNPDGTAQTKLTNNPAEDTGPAFS